MTQVSLKVVIRCADIQASRVFYGDMLGLELQDEWSEPHGDGCIYSLGSSLIELHEMTPSDERFHPAMREPVRVDKFDIQLEVPALEPWLERLEGRWKHSEPKAQPWGERTVRMRDPDGVLVTIYEKL